MNKNQSRRRFIYNSTLCGMAFVLKPINGLKMESLRYDHFLLGCSSLQTGINSVREITGIDAVKGGKHPTIGTHNALISLGNKSYLEIIAPDPEAPNLIPDYAFLKELNTPTLFMWAARTENIDELFKKVQMAGLKNSGISAGSRQRTDGTVLKWRSLSIETDFPEVVPFFIEWDKSSKHPSVDSPGGCAIESFEISYPDPVKPKKVFDQLGIGLPVKAGTKGSLQLKIKSPKGIVWV